MKISNLSKAYLSYEINCELNSYQKFCQNKYISYVLIL